MRDINEFIKVLSTEKDKAFLIIKDLGYASIGNKKVSLSTNLSGIGLYIEDGFNILALDTDKFLKYIINNFDNLINMED